MKGQFALIEVLVSALMLTSTIGAIIAVTYPISFSQKTFNFNEQNAFYDFSMLLYKNTSDNQCISSLENKCTYRLLTLLNSFYALSGSKLVVNSESVSAGSLEAYVTSKTECFPVDKNNTFEQVCLSVYSD